MLRERSGRDAVSRFGRSIRTATCDQSSIAKELMLSVVDNASMCCIQAGTVVKILACPEFPCPESPCPESPVNTVQCRRRPRVPQTAARPKKAKEPGAGTIANSVKSKLASIFWPASAPGTLKPNCMFPMFEKMPAYVPPPSETMSELPSRRSKEIMVQVFGATTTAETTDAPGVFTGVAKRPVTEIDSERLCRN